MTEEQQLESLRFALESSKLRHTEKDMEIVRLKEQVAGNERIIEGYQRFIRDNLKNAIKRNV
jgi:hypothetical protein